MIDEDLQKLERTALVSDDPNDVAAALRAKTRVGADDAELSELLRSFTSDIDAILAHTDLSEDRKALLKARVLVDEQISSAIENAIQPREGDAFLPSGKAILTSVMKELTPERAREILRFHEAKLVLTPITSIERYREELNRASQIMEGYREAYVTGFAEEELSAQAAQAQVEGNKIKSWKFAITEGAQTFDIPEWDNGRENFQQRINLFNARFEQSGMTRLDYSSYIALMVHGLRKGKPIDGEYLKHSRKQDAKCDWQFTLLNETDEERGLVGAACWLDDDRAHFRPAVMGDIVI